MDKKIKVLQLIDSHGWCGTKEQTYLITKYLSKFPEFDVHLALAFEHKEMENRLKNKVPLLYYEKDTGSKRRFNLFNYVRLYKLIAQNNYDVIIANSSWAYNYLVAILPFLKRKPKIIAMRRSGFIPSFFSKYFKYRWADRIVVVSKNVAEELKEKNFFPEKLVVIQSGVEIDRFLNNNEYRDEYRKRLGIEEDEKVFINVANYQPWRKGQDILLTAFKNLNYPKSKLLLVGHRTDSEEARKFIDKLGLSSQVIGLGFREDVEKLLQASDFFVLSSNSEGIAGALIQAMASGKVVLSTLAGGIGEYLKDGINGFSCPVGDVDCLTYKMKRMLSLTKEEYDKISNRAVKTALQYSIEDTAQRWRNLINEIIHRS